ncbi:glutathione-disulfide reductase [Microbulbifer thermotolerans]|uniref:glutathione-disulfide reductase n=1 Tax=Microbulbifer thermotolerans TaxID=252514 RepID=UPI002248DADB|nr:glutathione-disulfide reductase [Microbulbifer thermotolerans]MCX2794580.1 glutathione-disulfide reductase [Microbulbifer thermotolerans]MCX2831669.1 glutathione-disulfide reductase [Microbulbifer thermotolerans]
MVEFDFDLFVIGAGSGGVRAARMAAASGMRVAVAEDRYMGGTCVNVGCVPKKLFVYGSSYGEAFEDSAAYGWCNRGAEFEWETLRNNTASEVARLNGIYRKLLADAGVAVIEGRASLESPNAVVVNQKQYTAERILIATGSWPFVPDFPGREHVITSNEVFSMPEFPQRMLVVGGGYIAVEFAGIFAGLGAETHLSYRRDLFLRGFDGEIRAFVREEMRKKGVRLHFNHRICAIDKRDNGSLLVRAEDGSTLEVDAVLYATGRQANTKGLGLEKLGVVLHRDGTISVDDNFRTSVHSIYALGDVTGEPQLTPVALAEAMALVKHLRTGEPVEMDYNNIPTAVFCQPNIGTVGLSEEEARDSGIPVVVYKSEFRPMRHTISGRDERTLMKLVVDSRDDRVVGVHMVGQDAGEIIQGMAIALKAGATKKTFDQTVGIHPTAAEEFVTMRTPAS